MLLCAVIYVTIVFLLGLLFYVLVSRCLFEEKNYCFRVSVEKFGSVWFLLWNGRSGNGGSNLASISACKLLYGFWISQALAKRVANGFSDRFGWNVHDDTWNDCPKNSQACFHTNYDKSHSRDNARALRSEALLEKSCVISTSKRLHCLRAIILLDNRRSSDNGREAAKERKVCCVARQKDREIEKMLARLTLQSVKIDSAFSAYKPIARRYQRELIKHQQKASRNCEEKKLAKQ